MHLAARDLALLLAVVALWGFSFTAIKVGLRELPPLMLAGLRFVLAALPLVFFVRPPRMPWRYIAGYGFAIGVCQFGLLFIAIELGVSAGLSSLVIQVQVFLTIGLGTVFLGERLRREDLIGAAVATAGLVLLGVHEVMAGASATVIGFLLVIAAAFGWAAGNVVAKRAATEYHSDMFALVVWSSLVPPLPLFALAYALEGGRAAWATVLSAGPLSWGCVLLLAWGATLFGFASWAGLLHRYPTSLIAPFALLIPVTGLASGTIFLGEALAPLQMFGVALVLIGLAENVFGAGLRARLLRGR